MSGKFQAIRTRGATWICFRRDGEPPVMLREPVDPGGGGPVPFDWGNEDDGTVCTAYALASFLYGDGSPPPCVAGALAAFLAAQPADGWEVDALTLGERVRAYLGDYLMRAYDARRSLIWLTRSER